MSKRPAILITGAAKRVGAAIALYFAEHGYDIGLHYNNSKKDAEKTQKQIEKLGVSCVLFWHDLADIKGIPALMKQVKKALPNCGALINSASPFTRATLMETSEEIYDEQFAINLKAPFFMIQAFAKTFGKGAIINVVDSYITQNEGSHFAYLLSKKALASLTQMAAGELGPKIRVNGVCPGIIMLPEGKGYKDFSDKLVAQLPLKAHATPQDVAEAARWLITQEHITGQLIFVDGGLHVR